MPGKNRTLGFLIVSFVLATLSCNRATPTGNVGKAASTPTQIRPITTHPKYVETPQFAVISSGKNAEDKTLIVVDGEVVYVDRNRDGNFFGSDEQITLSAHEQGNANGGNVASRHIATNVFKIGEIAGHNLELRVDVLDDDFESKTPGEDQLITSFREERSEYGWLTASLVAPGTGIAQGIILYPQLENAEEFYVGGDWTFVRKRGAAKSLTRNGSNQFEVHISATLGVENVGHPRLRTDQVPEKTTPTALFTFQSMTNKSNPIVLTVPLDLRCWLDTFYGPVRVPENAASGDVHIEVLPLNWADTNVTGAEFTIPLE